VSFKPLLWWDRLEFSIQNGYIGFRTRTAAIGFVGLENVKVLVALGVFAFSKNKFKLTFS
jgi:hypothetical protein